MEHGGSMPQSQGLSNYPYPELNHPNYPHWYLTLQGPFWYSLFPVGLPVKILKALLPSSILATCPAYLHILDLITLAILGEWWSIFHHITKTRFLALSLHHKLSFRFLDIFIYIFHMSLLLSNHLYYFLYSPPKICWTSSFTLSCIFFY